ncbi:Rapid ALkalinization Factor [Heracleum sosnowskyi]|uniref:Rapid ALkalinization Factor n=1 Tax=Heracleum sosnowskyi TaxID=360622 RepID=A0AAD8GYM4_9APIA|nr:Rapid ALkalinization Factor [Heracleum sosnowskyi]
MAKTSTKIIELSLLCFFLIMTLICSCVLSLDAGSSNVSLSMELDGMMEWERSEGRFLAENKKLITPGVLKRDQAVCNGGGRGQSYSSTCLPPPSNSYNRGCSKIYRCRS